VLGAGCRVVELADHSWPVIRAGNHSDAIDSGLGEDVMTGQDDRSARRQVQQQSMAQDLRAALLLGPLRHKLHGRLGGGCVPRLGAHAVSSAAARADASPGRHLAVTLSPIAVFAFPVSSTGMIRALPSTSNETCTVPLHAVAFSQDVQTPPQRVREVAALAPTGEYHELERCGHGSAFGHRPHEVNALLGSILAHHHGTR
jgi:hypothetical protein